MITDFASWKLLQDKMLAAQQAQLTAATKLMGMGADFDGAVQAAQKVADANKHAWEAWLGLWGPKP